MSCKENFTALQPILAAIPSTDVQPLNMPVSTAIQEAENLYHRAKLDVDDLAGVGLDVLKIEALTTASGALRYAEGAWRARCDSRAKAQELWSVRAPEGFRLRDRLVRDFLFAYRNDAEVLALVRQIPTGQSNSDMIQDLTTLSAIGRANGEALDRIRFDKSLLDTAMQTADELGNILGESKSLGNDMRDLRDRAFTYLKTLVDEIREHGKYVFFRDKKRYRGYTSDYFRRANRAAARAAAAEEQTEEKKAA